MFLISCRKRQFLALVLSALYGTSLATASYGSEIDKVYALSRRRPPAAHDNTNDPQQPARDQTRWFRDSAATPTGIGTGLGRQVPAVCPTQIARTNWLGQQVPVVRPSQIAGTDWLSQQVSNPAGSGGGNSYSIPTWTSSGVVVYDTATARILVDLRDHIDKVYVYAQEVYLDSPMIRSGNVTMQVVIDSSLAAPHQFYKISFRDDFGDEEVFLVDTRAQKILISCLDRAIVGPQ